MALDFIVGFGAKDKGLRNYIGELIKSKDQITKDEWAVKIVGKNFEDVISALDRFKSEEIQINANIDYGTVFAQLQNGFDKYKSKFDLSTLFDLSNVDSRKLDDYLRESMYKIEDAIDNNGNPNKYVDDYKRIANIINSAKAGDGFKIDQSVIDQFAEFKSLFIDTKKLSDFSPSSDFFTNLKDELSKDQAALNVLADSLKDFIQSGANVKDSSDLDAVADKMEVINEKVSQTQKVRIFDGIKEQVYDVVKDYDAMIEKLKEVADAMETPVFQGGDLRRGIVNSEDFLPGDSLKFTLSRGNGSSPGTGQYWTQDLEDVFGWIESQKKGHNGFDRGVFATDLSKKGKLLNIPTADYYSELVDGLFSSIHNLIGSGIIGEGADGKLLTQYKDRLKGKDVSDIFSEYENIFRDLNISYEQFSKFISDEREDLAKLKSSSADMEDLLNKVKKEDAFGTRFLKKLTDYQGINASYLDYDDNTTRGSVLFDIDKQRPYDINFGGNNDIARTFYNMVLEKVLKNKAMNSDVDIDQLFDTLVDSKQIEIMGEEAASKMRSRILEASNNATDLSFSKINDANITTATSDIDNYISKLERLYQLQQTINNMQVESAYGKSYEETGKHIEQLNAQYEQTVAEIEKLRKIDDGSQEIKEQIGLLENLAVAYQNAIKESIPNDVSPGNWISKYTNIPRNELFGEERLYQDEKIRKNAEAFKNSLDQEILSIYRSSHENIDLSNISQEIINTSALSEIPGIMERITSAGKEATQTMEQFGDAVSGKGNGIGDTSNEEVERLQAELEAAQKEAESAKAEARFANDLADQASYDAYDAQREAEDLRSQLLDAERRASATDEIISEKDVEIANLKEQLSNVQKATEEGSETKTEADSFKDVEGTATDAAAAKELFNEQNSELPSKVDASVSSLENEATAFDLVTETALNAATAKELFVNQNIELAESAELSSEQLQKEAEYLEKIAQLTPNNQKEKSNKNQTNNKKEQSPEDLATKQATDLIARIKKLSSGSSDYLSGIWGLNDNPNNKSIISFLNEYDQEVSAVKAAVDALSQQWGEQNQKVREASSALNEYLNRMGVVTTTDLQKIAAQQIDKIDRAESVRRQQGSGFTDDYAEKLRSARDMAANILKELEGADFSKGFDKSKIIAWVQQLEEGKQILKEINDQENLLATKGSAEKLLGKINQDLSKGGLRGQLKKDYLELQSSVNEVVHSLDNVNLTPDGIEKSKSSLRELADQFQHLHTTMVETGQGVEKFSSKFATAINNQSAQFLATYFSFQDIIRYSKEIAQTVVGTDSALIELKKVSDASNERIQQSFTKSAETAQELGSTITSVINSTADWARLGYDVDQAEELARVTTLFQTVGDNMTQETASESLISTLKGFQLETSEAIDIVDKFNEVLAARSCRNANKDGMQLNLSKTNNTLKLLGHPKANLPNVSRKTEKSGWMLYGEIKAFERMSYVV